MTRTQQKTLQAILETLTKFLGVKAKIVWRAAAPSTITEVNLDIADPARLIGEEGMTLLALQHIARLIFRKTQDSPVNFVLDISDYRHDRRGYLEEMARSAAAQVAQENRLVVLKPMNSFERRIVHLTLADDDQVETESLGEAEERRVIIRPRKK